MENSRFKELYYYYQSLMLESFEEGITNYGWKIIKREYRSSYTKDLANLELHIRVNADPKNDAVFNFHLSWLELLYLDRDDKPLRFDVRILVPKFGMQKAKYIIQTRIEMLDAIVRNDHEKIDLLGKHLSRFRKIAPDKDDPSKDKVILHYENGIKLSDAEKTTPEKGNYDQ